MKSKSRLIINLKSGFCTIIIIIMNEDFEFEMNRRIEHSDDHCSDSMSSKDRDHSPVVRAERGRSQSIPSAFKSFSSSDSMMASDIKPKFYTDQEMREVAEGFDSMSEEEKEGLALLTISDVHYSRTNLVHISKYLDFVDKHNQVIIPKNLTFLAKSQNLTRFLEKIMNEIAPLKQLAKPQSGLDSLEAIDITKTAAYQTKCPLVETFHQLTDPVYEYYQ